MLSGLRTRGAPFCTAPRARRANNTDEPDAAAASWNGRINLTSYSVVMLSWYGVCQVVGFVLLRRDLLANLGASAGEEYSVGRRLVLIVESVGELVFYWVPVGF